MKIRILTFLALLAAWLPARAVENLASLLPDDPTVYIFMRDANFGEKLAGHPIAKIFGESELRKAFAPLMKLQEGGRERAEKIYREETGMSVAELNKLCTGGMAMGMRFDFVRLTEEMGKSRSGGTPPSPFEFIEFTVALKFDGDDALTEKIARAYGRILAGAAAAHAAADAPKGAVFPDDYDASTDDYSGVKLHLWKLKPGAKAAIPNPCHAVFDGTLVVSMSEQGLRGVVDRVKKGGASLADSQRHARMLKTAKESDTFAFFDLASVVLPLMEKAKKEGGFSAGQSLMLMRALGLHQLDFLYFTLDATGGRSDIGYGLTFHDRPGIIQVLAVDGPGTVPAFIPPDAESAGYGTLHLERVLAGVEAVVKEGVPMAGDMIGTQLDELKKRTGVDIRRDIIANLGPDLWDASAPLPDDAAEKEKDSGTPAAAALTQSQVFALKLKNRSAVELAVDTLINKLASDSAMFEKREYQGFEIHNVKGAPVSYVFTDDWAVISVGPPNLLERTLARIAKGGGEHLFAMPGVKAAFAGLPDGEDGSSYMDVEKTADRLLAVLTTLGRGPAGAAFKTLINFDDPPKKLNLPIVAGIRTYHDDTALFFRAHFSEKVK